MKLIRDVRFLRVLAQVVFLGLVLLFCYWIYNNVASKGVVVDFSFLERTAGFTVSDAIPHQRDDSNLKLFLVGVVNTLRVIVIGIILASILGLIAGIARLSKNWLINKIAAVYVETIRNTPLLVQLFFWYIAVFLQLPGVREAIRLPGEIILSQRGLILPRPFGLESWEMWSVFLLEGLLVGLFVFIMRRRHLRRIERPGFPLLWGLGAFAGIALITWFILPGSPVALEFAEFQGFNYSGGLELTPEFAALLFGLVVYTGAFIAEIVRAGIQSVSKGQREASNSLGLGPVQTLRLVILPQALRVIVPPLTSQYLNLAKNSSLASATGYKDLFGVSQTIRENTGREIEIILMIAGSYLILSLGTSLFMNWYNRKIKLVER